jgi:hypothetical protein
MVYAVEKGIYIKEEIPGNHRLLFMILHIRRVYQLPIAIFHTLLSPAETILIRGYPPARSNQEISVLVETISLSIITQNGHYIFRHNLP